MQTAILNTPHLLDSATVFIEADVLSGLEVTCVERGTTPLHSPADRPIPASELCAWLGRVEAGSPLRVVLRRVGGGDVGRVSLKLS
jgi:hypothetical protein